MIALGQYPTPVVQVRQTWVKRDDLTGAAYGGNKVRKLERFFAAAEAEGKRRILTVGAVGSHQVVATAIYGRDLGFAVDAVLVPQPDSAHARANVGLALMPMSVARAHSRRDVVARPLTDAADSGIALVWPRASDDPRLDTFIGIVRGRTANSSR